MEWVLWYNKVLPVTNTYMSEEEVLQNEDAVENTEDAVETEEE